MWTACGQRLVHHVRQWSATSDSEQRLDNVLALAVAAHVISNVLPLDLTIRPSDLWHKYKGGGVRLWPFQNLVPATSEAWLNWPS